MQEVILNLAPTGMVPTKKMNPWVPLSPKEIIQTVRECAELGVAIFHLHARDDRGVPTYKKDVYARIISGIRETHPDAIICVSLSGRNFPEFEKRSEPLFLSGDLKPDMASLTLSSLNFARTASINSPDMVRRLAETMAEKGIKPELEVFDLGMVNYANYLIEKNIIRPPFYFNVLLGNLASAQATPLHVSAITQSLPAQSVWSAGGLGACQLTANTLGLLFGNGVRVGLEDYLWLDKDRNHLTTNVDMVKRILSLGNTLGKTFASPTKVRHLLGLSESGA